jgi:type I restriction enzyme M protein
MQIDGKTCIIEYETDTDLRDTEQVPLLEEGGIEAFIHREVLPYTSDAWIKKPSLRSCLKSSWQPVDHQSNHGYLY